MLYSSYIYGHHLHVLKIFMHTLTQGTGDDVRKWTKRVQKEWEILQNNLPGTLCDRQYPYKISIYYVIKNAQR